MFVNIVNYFLVIVLSLIYVNSELCLTRTIVSKNSRLKRWTTIGEAKVVQKCCDGYSQENLDGGIISCTPICKSNCMNGYCEKPEVCACNAGYTKLNDTTCEPVCEGDGLHCTCIAPNFCLCFPGFKFVNGTCQPVCTKPCGNGTCVAPDTCECNDGYYMTTFQESNTSCQPRCIGCASERSLESNEETTTTTRNPLVSISTYKYSTEDTTTSTTTTSTTTTPYFVSSSSSTRGVLDNDVSSEDPGKKTWMQRNGMFIWLLILLISSIVFILLLVLLRVPTAIINYFKGVKNRRSYDVKGAFRKGTASGPSKSQPAPDEKEVQV